MYPANNDDDDDVSGGNVSGGSHIGRNFTDFVYDNANLMLDNH